MAIPPSALKAPRRRGGTRRRDLPQRTQHRRVMTDTTPSKIRDGLPPWSVHFTHQPGELRVRFKTSSRITELSQHETNGREFQECEGVSVEIFPVLGEAAATVEPRNGAFDNPTLG